MDPELDDLALDIPCYYCNAQPDLWCITKTGNRATWLHAPRTNPVYSAFGLGYGEGLRHGRGQ